MGRRLPIALLFLLGIAAVATAERRVPPPPDPRVNAYAGALSPSAPERLQQKLTPREREILMLLGDGLANKQIGRRLGITEKTVKGHLTKIYQTIGVTDRTQAALWAERRSVRAGTASEATA